MYSEKTDIFMNELNSKLVKIYKSCKDSEEFAKYIFDKDYVYTTDDNKEPEIDTILLSRYTAQFTTSKKFINLPNWMYFSFIEFTGSGTCTLSIEDKDGYNL